MDNIIVIGRSFLRADDRTVVLDDPTILTFMRRLKKTNLDTEQCTITQKQKGRKVEVVFEGYLPEIPILLQNPPGGILIGRRVRPTMRGNDVESGSV